MLTPVAPVLHFTLPVQPLAVNVAFSVPQMLLLLALTTGATGLVNTSITKPFDASLSPQLVLHFAVYVPAVFTTIDKPVAPLLHVIVPFAQPLVVNVVLSPSQQIVFVVLITNLTGVSPFVITTGVLDALSPQLLLHVAL